LIIQDFLSAVQAVYKTGQATEHSYRAAIGGLVDALSDDITAINEPKRVKCGAPDFIVNLKDVAIGHIEAKDIEIDLKVMKGANADQKKRYTAALPNLIYTNCLDWDFYRDGELYAQVSIADPLMGIQPKPDQFDTLLHLLQEFIAQRPQTIKSSKTLAKMMAGKAVLMKDVLANALQDEEDENPELEGQYLAFKEHLIHDISKPDFADIYAETITYGMFAARLHDPTLETFSRQEALDLLPKSNPFLRKFFGYIAGPELDDRLVWIIDELAAVFLACDVHKMLESYGKVTGRNDPFIHFYEDFLKEYNPAKRKSRGVWYTPEPVVNFIVRAVDEVLQTEFDLPMGLADTSKVTIDWDTGQTDNKGKAQTIKKEVHRVQVLDPATGTGTFLAEVIKQIAPKVKSVASGKWSGYIEQDLIPRIHGFELLMASYAMCHMKLDMILTELGYQPTKKNPPRLGVYLTNSLEEGEPANQQLPFARWLSDEVREANTIKRDMPIMCVIGNPPYSGHSSNKGEWITGLLNDYKTSPELQRPGQAKWLSDDYVKFIRFAEHMIEKNGEGILGLITNHAYLDNPTFKDMRRHLMDTFDRIYIHDLHGNSMKKEVGPGGLVDKNIFDIRPGVAIIIAIKHSEKVYDKTSVFHSDVWGSRSQKNGWLLKNKITALPYVEVTPSNAPWNFIPQDEELLLEYRKWPNLIEFFRGRKGSAPGIVTTHDQFAISMSKSRLAAKVKTLLNTQSEDEARSKFRLCSQNQWNYDKAKTALSSVDWESEITPILYRPFDKRFTVFNRHVAVHRREKISNHFVNNKNIGLIFSRQAAQGNTGYNHTLVTDAIFDNRGVYSNKGISQVAPLYLYPDEQDLDQTRRINFDPKLWKQLQAKAKHPKLGTPDEVQTFDYIYSVLHCPAYRDTYKEFLKIDFPRIPWPASPDEFWDVSAKGKQLRELHLMQAAAIGDTPYPFKGQGDDVVDKPALKDGQVWINKDQYFDAVPTVAWDFYIGGYQPAQKWLKDRKGRELSFDDIMHYQKIIKILAETDRIMQTIKMDL